MTDDITNNQTLCYIDSSLTYPNIKKSFVERDKLILILEDSLKITLAGKNIDTTGHKKRIHELISITKEEGLEIREKSVKHYTKVEDDEYVLFKWQFPIL